MASPAHQTVEQVGQEGRRRSPRGLPPAGFRVRARGPAGPLTDFRILDLSSGGLGLTSEHPILVGSRLRLTIEWERETVDLDAVVRWRSEGGRARRFGVEFLVRDPRIERLAPLFA